MRAYFRSCPGASTAASTRPGASPLRRGLTPPGGLLLWRHCTASRSGAGPEVPTAAGGDQADVGRPRCPRPRPRPAGSWPSSSPAPPGTERVVRLETNRALGRGDRPVPAAGDREVAAFSDEPYAHHWFEKDLGRRRFLVWLGVLIFTHAGPGRPSWTKRCGRDIESVDPVEPPGCFDWVDWLIIYADADADVVLVLRVCGRPTRWEVLAECPRLVVRDIDQRLEVRQRLRLR